MTAQRLLDALWREPKTDERFFDPLIGSWRLLGQTEIIDIDLEKDGRFTAVGFEREKDQPGKKRWSGDGRWVLRYDELSLLRYKVFAPNGRRMLARRDIFRDKKVLAASNAEATLEGGPKMVRRD